MGVTIALQKFATTSFVNAGMRVLKDRSFANRFRAPGTEPKRVPGSVLALFALRDSITVASSFSLVQPVAERLRKWNHELSKERAATIAQLVTPVAAQLVNTPAYLLGLSLFNEPSGPR